MSDIRCWIKEWRLSIGCHLTILHRRLLQRVSWLRTLTNSCCWLCHHGYDINLVRTYTEGTQPIGFQSLPIGCVFVMWPAYLHMITGLGRHDRLLLLRVVESCTQCRLAFLRGLRLVTRKPSYGIIPTGDKVLVSPPPPHSEDSPLSPYTTYKLT